MSNQKILMSEKQQDLIRRPAELTHEPLQGSQYFSRISLGDIYGRTTLKPGTQIVTDVPYGKYSELDWKSEEFRALALALQEKYDIPHAAVYSSEWKWGRDENDRFGNLIKNPRLVISVGMGAPMTNWAPFVAERGAIAALATSISGSDKPVILDVGAGNGFTSKLLAADSSLRVVGIDLSLSRYDQLPDTPGDVTLREADVFDLIEEFGPARSPQDTARIKDTLQRIKDSFMKDKKMYFWGMQHGVFRNMGYGDFGKEVAELRKAAGRYREQSPVDLVVCSFMTTGDDLTLAIKDGVRPKAIVYVMPLNGLSGVGNYYFGGDKKRGIENEVVSFNPGKEYHTVARWQTFWQDEWGRFCYDQGFGIEQADVVVQLRNDVKPKQQREIPVVRTHPFDEEIVDAIRTGRRHSEHFNADYYRGIMERMILRRPNVELPYKMLK